MKTRIKVIMRARMRARSKLSVNIANHVVVEHIEKSHCTILLAIYVGRLLKNLFCNLVTGYVELGTCAFYLQHEIYHKVLVSMFCSLSRFECVYDT